MKTLIRLCERVSIDDRESAMKPVHEFTYDKPFPVDTVFVVKGKTWAYTGYSYRNADHPVMLYAPEVPIVIDDADVRDAPETP